MRKKYWIAVCVLCGILLLGMLVYLGARIVPSLIAQKNFSELKTDLLNDDNGGDTPVETIRLFKTALEAGDLKIASKYFIYEKQEKILQDMENLQKEGKFPDLLDYLNQILDEKNPKREYITNSPDMVTINILSNKPDFKEFSIELRRPGNDITGSYKTWKIKSM
ncbi:MAG: hypothetical protein NTX26_00895 [Candidatus Parcubacteria bacterium]|nr:hypothetical protein [Candidatus Parcubacteria bacterium]